MKDWTIADRYFYQAGPLPEDRVKDGIDLATGLGRCPCKKHRRYLAKRAPRTACEACWRFYVERNP